MMKSMTGFGRSAKEIGNSLITVEMKAVNHRYSEINMRLPRQLLFLEDRLKKRISRDVKRGKVDVYVNVHGSLGVERRVQVDWAIFEQYHQVYNDMVKHSVASEAFPVDQLLLHEDVVSVQEKEEVTDDLGETVEAVLESAVNQLRDMKINEGKAMFEDMMNRIEALHTSIHELEKLAPRAEEEYRLRLQKRMEDIIGQYGSVEEQRVLTEVAVFAEKTDFSEELTRMASHLQQFTAMMKDEEPVGRKLDFLMQEMNREVNTIGSKANQLEVNHTVVHVKSELEKIREQIQNIE